MAKKKAVGKKDQGGSSSELDFEHSLREVEQIVARLEGGQLGLSESLQQYEMGIKQLKRCHALLDAAEQRVNVLAGFDAEGNPVLEPLQKASASRKAGSAAQSTEHSPPAGDEAGEWSENGSDVDAEDTRPGLF